MLCSIAEKLEDYGSHGERTSDDMEIQLLSREV